MKILSSMLLSLLTFLSLVIALSLYSSLKQDQIDEPTTSEEDSKPTTYTESPVQPERKPNISDIKYARALMSHPRSKITDINVLNDYDSVIKTATDNINNGVGNKEDYELYNIWEDMQEYEQTTNN